MILKISTIFCFLIIIFNSSFSQEYKPPLIIKSLPLLEKQLKTKYDESRRAISEDLKNDQALYLKNNYKSRYETSLEFIHQGKLLNNGLIFEKVDSLFQIILKSNPQLNQDKKVFVFYDQVANAFTFGDEIIYVNLGLLYRVKSFEELMLVMCHEIAHNELNHFEIKTLNYTKSIINDSVEKAVRKIYRKEFGHVTQLNELFLPWILTNKEQSRQFEFASDSLGIQLFKKCNFSMKNGNQLYDLLKNIEHERDTTLIDIKKELFLPSILEITRRINYKKEASLGFFEKKEDTLDIQLRTHPFPEEREKKYSYEFVEAEKNQKEFQLFSNNDFLNFTYQVECEMINSSILNKNIGRSIYYWIQLNKKFPNESYYRDMLSLNFAILAYEKSYRREGNIIDGIEIDSDENYDRLLTFLRNLKPQEALDLSIYYLENFNQDKNSEFSQYSKAIIAGLQKDYLTFKPIYENLIKNKENYFQEIIKEIYSINRISINKL